MPFTIGGDIFCPHKSISEKKRKLHNKSSAFEKKWIFFQ